MYLVYTKYEKFIEQYKNKTLNYIKIYIFRFDIKNVNLCILYNKNVNKI